MSSLEELESRNDRDEAFAARRKAEREGDESGEDGEGKKEGSDGDESEGASEEEEGGEGVQQGGAAAAAAASAGRVEPGGAEAVMQKPKAKKGVASLIEVANPNAKVNAGRMMKAKDMDMAAAPVELSRREREAVEAQRKKDHYMKLHAEGKTQEAQVDMARLALVRKRREDAEKQKAEEGEGQGEAAKERMEKAKANASSGPQKLNPLEVKKMNPTRLKELLKERDQSLQGSKKDLISRLLDWEKTNQA